MPWNYQYHLPPELIAQSPANPRDSSRLMVINKTTGEISHHIFSELPSLLNPSDVLVFNDTKVIPARLFGTKPTGGKVEILLLKHLNSTDWEFISHPGLKPGQIINFSKNKPGKVISENVIYLGLGFDLDHTGHIPLPPYIHSSEPEAKLREQYQTVYARESGSAAAPTAGLHFTPNLLKRLATSDQRLQYLTLHVGLGTFKTPTAEQIAAGKLHSESFSISSQTAANLNNYKKQNLKIISVGTTTTRVLESQSQNGVLQSGSGETDIFIQPPYQWQFVDGMITNFHLPGTSLLMLISALASPDIIRHAYEVAIAEKYRFYSFGDACLII